MPPSNFADSTHESQMHSWFKLKVKVWSVILSLPPTGAFSNISSNSLVTLSPAKSLLMNLHYQCSVFAGFGRFDFSWINFEGLSYYWATQSASQWRPPGSERPWIDLLWVGLLWMRNPHHHPLTPPPSSSWLCQSAFLCGSFSPELAEGAVDGGRGWRPNCLHG